MDSTVSLGALDGTTWTYENKDLSFEFQFPHNWFYQYISIESKDDYTLNYVRIGEADESKSHGTSTTTLSELWDVTKKNNSYFFCTLYKDSLDIPTTDKATSFIHMGIIFSETKDDKNDLEIIKQRRTISSEYKIIESNIKDSLSVGNWTQPYWELISEKDGQESYSLMSVRNYGCYDLFIMALADNKENKEEILEIFKNNIKPIE